MWAVIVTRLTPLHTIRTDVGLRHQIQNIAQVRMMSRLLSRHVQAIKTEAEAVLTQTKYYSPKKQLGIKTVSEYYLLSKRMQTNEEVISQTRR